MLYIYEKQITGPVEAAKNFNFHMPLLRYTGFN